MDITFILGGSIVASLIIQILKAIAGKIEGKYGALLTQVILLIASFAVAGVGIGFNFLPPNIVEMVMLIFASSISVYEVIYKGIYEDIIKQK